MVLNTAQMIGLLISLLGIAALAVITGMKKSAAGNVNSAPVVAGLIMGTLVGGSSTVGTAQLAYNYGLSAWWFTLGGGLACLVLALLFVRPWRKSGAMTLIAIISREFGPKVGLTASLLSSVGTFINIISQLIAGTAVIAVVAPGLGLLPALLITAAFMALYVIGGGIRGAGVVGILKLALLYVSMICCGILALHLSGGLSGFGEMVRGIDNPEGVRFGSLFARGVGKDGGAGLSLILGVLTTQTYAQAVMSARSDRQARLGALVSAVLIPPIGAGGILVGLFMRAHFPGIEGLQGASVRYVFLPAVDRFAVPGGPFPKLLFLKDGIVACGRLEEAVDAVLERQVILVRGLGRFGELIHLELEIPLGIGHELEGSLVEKAGYVCRDQVLVVVLVRDQGKDVGGLLQVSAHRRAAEPFDILLRPAQQFPAKPLPAYYGIKHPHNRQQQAPQEEEGEHQHGEEIPPAGLVLFVFTAFPGFVQYRIEGAAGSHGRLEKPLVELDDQRKIVGRTESLRRPGPDLPVLEEQVAVRTEPPDAGVLIRKGLHRLDDPQGETARRDSLSRSEEGVVETVAVIVGLHEASEGVGHGVLPLSGRSQTPAYFIAVVYGDEAAAAFLRPPGAVGIPALPFADELPSGLVTDGEAGDVHLDIPLPEVVVRLVHLRPLGAGVHAPHLRHEGGAVILQPNIETDRVHPCRLGGGQEGRDRQQDDAQECLERFHPICRICPKRKEPATPKHPPEAGHG